MSKCKDCTYFFSIPEDADDFEQGRGDCVIEQKDEKGKYWLSKPIFDEKEPCADFKNR